MAEASQVKDADWGFGGLRFLTALEVAQILKVNHQVLLRKLQSGELPGYKVGKDWRIEESELRRWLESVSNQTARSQAAEAAAASAEEESIRRHFFVGGRLTTIPAKRSKRAVVLRMLARRFEVERPYREAEVNEILKSVHSDFCTLRRELVMAKLIRREKGRYWRPAPQPSGDVTGEGESGAVRKRSAATGRGEGSVPRERT